MILVSSEEDDLISTVSHDRLERKLKDRKQAHEW